MKCTKCQVEKSENDFNWKIKEVKRKTQCKECHAVYRRQHYLDNRQKYIDKAKKRAPENKKRIKTKIWEYLLNHPCVDCGEADPVVLEFDHVRGVKKFGIGQMRSGTWGWLQIKKEIAKCEVRCANCHRRRTARQFNWYVWEYSSIGRTSDSKPEEWGS